MATSLSSDRSRRAVVSVGSLVSIQENQTDGLKEQLHFELTRPVDFRLELPLEIVEGTARRGAQFTISGSPKAVFEPGTTQGRLSGVGETSDIQLVDNLLDESDVPRRFTVRVRPIFDLIDVDDAHSTCVVCVLDDEKPSVLGDPIRFASSGGDVSESQAFGTRMTVRAGAAIAEDRSFTIAAYSRKPDGMTELGRKVFVLPANEVQKELGASEVVEASSWTAAGLDDDDALGPPSEIIFRLSAAHPLQAVAPRELVYRIVDDDPAGRPKDTAKYAIILVNGSRLGEPNDGVLAAARKSIKSIPLRSFQEGVVLVGPSSTILLEGEHWGPRPDIAFLPLAQEEHGVDSQLRRIVEAVTQVRSECEDPNIRIVVIWPERELAFFDVDTISRHLRESNIGPVSILCPGVDYEMSPQQSAILSRGDTQVTIRSPGIDELLEHVRFAVQGYPLPEEAP